ncbi:hypothetical protein RWK44_34315 [Rhizobium sp. 25PS6]|uniref:hypothetical protein n=1 Tax=Rhizobium sp. 25PS6 TaxID=3075622 RepID=UPI0028FD7728|nr:hypothetical protein [Rhizobium sp. 25PS6]MDU0365439.1 hypothetical protein [Rhizobium sp. 25PS6]
MNSTAPSYAAIRNPTGKIAAANCHPAEGAVDPLKGDLQGDGMTLALAATMWVVLVSDRYSRW